MTAAFSFTPLGGSALDLHDTTNFRLLALRGSGIPGLDHHAVRTPLQDGESYIRTLLLPRYLTAILAVKGSSFDNLQTQKRSLVTKLNPKTGEGTLKWKPVSSGTEYGIKCYV